MRASHKVVSDAEAPGAAGALHLGGEKYKGHLKSQEDPDTKFQWWGWRCAPPANFLPAILKRNSAQPAVLAPAEWYLACLGALNCTSAAIRPQICQARLCARRFRDWGYAAAIIQFVGATLFSISTIISVPHVLPAEATTNYWTWDATFWTLQVLCGTTI